MPDDSVPELHDQDSDRLTREAIAAMGSRLKEVSLQYEPAIDTLWITLEYRERACFSQQQLDDYRRLFADLKSFQDACRSSGASPLKFAVFRSSEPGVWCLGGDLDLFSSCIRTQDRDRLLAYAYGCVDAGYLANASLDCGILTVCLVQGQALGGGLESARSCQVVIAEEGSTFGLPEIRFNMFPGMGAFSFLGRRIGLPAAIDLMTSGEILDADRLLEMRGIDRLVPKGEGESATRAYIRSIHRQHGAHLAIQAARQIMDPISLEEVRAITKHWVESAMKVPESDLKLMARIVRSQAGLRSRLQASE